MSRIIATGPMNHTILEGNVLNMLPTLPAEHYNAVLCDPPYGLSFMGAHWDHGVPSNTVWREVWRVLKPGAVLMAFGGSRTWHRLAVNIEDAGFEMFDTIEWIYGSGFPKSCDISKAIDREAGMEREVVGDKVSPDGILHKDRQGQRSGKRAGICGTPVPVPPRNSMITAPATPAAHTWQGYGSALKPAHEPILCFRKPRNGTYAQTAQEHGTGCLNIDGCRVGWQPQDLDPKTNRSITPRAGLSAGDFTNESEFLSDVVNTKRIPYVDRMSPQGRWPANLILDQSAADLLDEMSGELTSGKPSAGKAPTTGDIYGQYEQRSLMGYGDTGGASRFFQVLPTFIYEAKAATSERNEGVTSASHQRDASRNADQPSMNGGEGNPYNRGAQPVANHHPTVKPLALCEYLARLIVPPKEYRADARILVPFAGSGSEMIGALMAGWLNVDGIELMSEYVEIARHRLAHWREELSIAPRKLNGHTADYANSPLFAEAFT